MAKFVRTTVLLLAVTMALSTLSGCTNWKKKYQALDVEHQNLQGLYDNCKTSLDSSAMEKARLGQQLTESQQALEEMQKQTRKTGFEGYDVALDPAAGTITVTLQEAILFASGQASLKKTTDLDRIYDVIREKYRGKKIDIVGHTDTDPIKKSKWQDNWELSAQRALTVVRYLVSRGVRSEDIRAAGCGESRPVDSNSSAGGKAKNRRVEIVVHMR